MPSFRGPDRTPVRHLAGTSTALKQLCRLRSFLISLKVPPDGYRIPHRQYPRPRRLLSDSRTAPSTFLQPFPPAAAFSSPARRPSPAVDCCPTALRLPPSSPPPSLPDNHRRFGPSAEAPRGCPAPPARDRSAEERKGSRLPGHGLDRHRPT
jgi:hypothetical protein